MRVYFETVVDIILWIAGYLNTADVRTKLDSPLNGAHFYLLQLGHLRLIYLVTN